MHLPFRRLLLIVAIVAFAAIAPLIILYAVGYRPVTNTTPQPVGVVLVNSFPRKANVSVHGTLYGTTPRSIPNLLPGIADIQVAKDGYQTWGKKLEIKPIQATDARAIKLIPTNPVQDVISSDVSTFSVSPDASTIAIATSDHKIFVTDINGKFKTNFITLKSPITSLVWSSDSTYILVSTEKSEPSIVHFSNQQLEKMLASLPSDFTNGTWDVLNNHDLLGIVKKNQLIRYDILLRTIEIIDPSINNYVQVNSDLITQKTDNTIIKSNSVLPITKRVTSFIVSPNGDLAMILESGELQIIQKNNSILSVAEHALSASWSPDGLMLLVQTSANELNIYNLSNNPIQIFPIHELNLLARLSKAIQGAQWFSDNSHILYETDGTIICSEIDLRDHVVTNIITAAPKDSLYPTWISNDGKSIINVEQTSSSTNLVRTWLVTTEDK